MLCAFFWVNPLRLNFVCRRFGTLFHLHRPAYEDGTDRVFRNVGIQNSAAGELPRKKHTTQIWLFKVTMSVTKVTEPQ
jgi:hypothetical protein